MAIALDEFIAGRESGAHEQPAHHRYVVTVFGLYGRPCGTFLPVSAIVTLLATLGYEAPSVRSSISRLKKRDVLVSERVDGRSSYALAPDLEPHMLDGDQRIFAPRAADVDDPWLLVSFSVPESQRHQRHKIRSGLARIGFGTVNSGVGIAPARVRAAALDYMEKHGFSEYVQFFLAEPVDAGDLRGKIASWWDLEKMAHGYRGFIDAYAGEIERWASTAKGGEHALRDAFRVYVPMVTEWRRLTFADPGLPAELLPPEWEGAVARRLFEELNRELAPLSARYVQRVITS